MLKLKSSCNESFYYQLKLPKHKRKKNVLIDLLGNFVNIEDARYCTDVIHARYYASYLKRKRFLYKPTAMEIVLSLG